MMERPAAASVEASPKSSENDPPAANQPLGDEEAAKPTSSDDSPADPQPKTPAPGIVQGKPDGEVDTGA